MSDPFADAVDLLLADHPGREEIVRSGQLFEAASAQGHAEASERCAMFEAFGMARPQSWERALDYLCLAAKQGSRSAAEQLLLLRDNNSDAELPPACGGAEWDDIRAQVGILARLQVGEKKSLSETPRIRIIEGFATPAECRWLMTMASDHLAPATVFDNVSGQQKLDPARDNSHLVLRIAEMNVFTEVIRNRIAAATGIPVPVFEPSQLLYYEVGQHFRPHHDFLEPSNDAYRAELERFGQRIATFLIYLNDDYSGGETTFPAIDLRHRGQAGDALFFANVDRDGAPDRTTLHAGLPPTSGEKWVFSQWIRDRFPAN